jgi:hypothetical protein
MSDKQNSQSDSDPSKTGEQPSEQNGSTPKSYYYDDSTGYEIYKEEVDDDEEQESA